MKTVDLESSAFRPGSSQFLALRDQSHAQVEAQVYAKAVTQLLEPHLPGLMELYREIIKGD